MKSIGIIDYQINNLSSIYHAIKSLNYNPQLITEKNNKSYDILVIPGTGSFAYGMKSIKDKGYEKLIYDHIEKEKLLIAVCLGFQMLFKKSFEYGETNGLGILDGDIIPFSNECNKPLIGWSKLTLCENNHSPSIINQNLKDNFFYHVHSYYLSTNIKDYALTFSKNNKLEYISSICLKNIFGFQFHPEKSGINGINLLDSIFKNYEKI